MSTLKLTKTELRNQQTRLTQFQRYLPTLQLKKAMLQFEVFSAEMEIVTLQEGFRSLRSHLETFSPFFLEKVEVNLLEYAEVLHVKKHYENIAGVEVPLFEKVVFKEAGYPLLDTPAWTDRATELVREFATNREKIAVAEEKKRALEKELRDVSIRVNLFEKILIPRAQSNMAKIRIFLSDQQLAAVAQAKVAKNKIAKLKRVAS
ncbi:MAG: V-type ATP synthase subunit D [Chlamydiae bacterium]|nr:V-type ATP synthase subunit D [Chlamydiota bacterium]